VVVLEWVEIGGGLLYICTNRPYKVLLNHDVVPVAWDLYSGAQTGKWVLVRSLSTSGAARLAAERFEDGFV
jgi:hypothetical protein